jgi:hypothetical protein
MVVGKKHWIWGSNYRSAELVWSWCAVPAPEAKTAKAIFGFPGRMARPRAYPSANRGCPGRDDARFPRPHCAGRPGMDRSLDWISCDHCRAFSTGRIPDAYRRRCGNHWLPGNRCCTAWRCAPGLASGGDIARTGFARARSNFAGCSPLRPPRNHYFAEPAFASSVNPTPQPPPRPGPPDAGVAHRVKA